MRYFIYQTTNINNNKFYIGQHQCEGEFLDGDYYGSGTALMLAIKKHGIEWFTREVLLECTSAASLDFMEKVYVGPEEVENKQCYNLMTGGGSSGIPGVATRANIAAAMKGKVLSQKTKDKISAAMMGKKKSEATKDKTSAAMKGNTNGLGNKNGRGNKGIVHTDEQNAAKSARKKEWWRLRKLSEST
jgi:group I intron endonuclease